MDGWVPIACVMLAVVLPLAWLGLRSRRPPRAQREARRSQFASTRQPRLDAALDEWRGMREALKAAEHTRFESKQPGSMDPRPARLERPPIPARRRRDSHRLGQRTVRVRLRATGGKKP